MPAPEINLTAPEKPVALVVDATFDGERYVVDTTTIDGQRVVIMQTKDGVRYLTPTETLALARSLLSRLAYVGFPEPRADSSESVADRLRRIEAGVERTHGVHEGDSDLSELLVPSAHVVRVAGLQPGVGEVEGVSEVVGDLAHADDRTGAVAQ